MPEYLSWLKTEETDLSLGQLDQLGPIHLLEVSTMKKFLMLIATTLILCFSVNQASAGELLKCEKRNRPARSKVSVEVEDLTPGAIYTGLISSGNNSAQASIAADIGGVVEYDFDSNPADIAAGATRIASGFIGSNVSLIVTDAMGVQVEKTPSPVGCRVR